MNVVEIADLSKTYDKKSWALDKLSLSIKEGEIFGIFGPNGSGKTTTVRLLNGVLDPSAGTASILGMSITSQGPEIRAQCGVMTETAAAYEYLSARENLQFFGMLHQMDDQNISKRSDYLLSLLGLCEAEHRPLKTFSTGMRKKLLLAISMLHKPRLIFLDEPTSGLDPEASKNVNDLIRTLAKKEGVTVFLCTHQLKYAEELCSVFGFLKEGRLLACGRFEELQAKYDTHITLEIRGKNLPKNLEFVQESDGVFRRDIQAFEDAGEIIRTIVQGGGTIFEARQIKASLEDLYFSIQKRTDYAPNPLGNHQEGH
ncbi:MAG: ABC transporter ATP-binding protein [Candidatus Riflebacteria bacterium]|nr:ABC transporter ATP-binding protein [Candidatus Riflebacteria bacterium]